MSSPASLARPFDRELEGKGDPALAVAVLAVLATYALRFALLVHDETSWRAWFLRERGILERAEGLILGAALIVFATVLLRALRSPASIRVRGWLGLLTLLTLFAFGEEVAWGQYLIGVEPGAWMLANNVQGDLTLHNLDFTAMLGMPAGPIARLVEEAINLAPYLLCVAVWVGLPAWRRSGRGRWLEGLPLPRDGVALFLAANLVVYVIVDVCIADVAEIFELAIALTFLLAALDLLRARNGDGTAGA